MYHRTSIGKYIDSTALMTTERLRPGYSDILSTEDQCTSSGAVMSTELETSIQKER